MRRPHTLVQSKSNQQGLALFIVLMMMIAVALLVVATMQSYNTEQRINTNDADRKLAFSLAESALREGENVILNLPDPVTFNDNRDNGLCRVASTAEKAGSIKIIGTPNAEAWLRKCGDKLCIDDKGKKYPEDVKVSSPNGVSKNLCYIIEYVGNSSTGANIYRATAKVWGKNDNATVMVQSYINNEQESAMIKASRSYGLTPVEMLITVTIIGILTIITMPSYNRYVERGYLPQVHADPVSISDNARIYIAKNPGTKIDSDKLKDIISKSTTAEITERYGFVGLVPDDRSCRYLLSVTPKTDTGYI